MPLFTKSAALAPVPAPHLELAHILFLDMVGYSLLSMQAQAAYTQELQDIVRRDPAFLIAHSRGELVCRPTGDGMAIVFLRDAFAPLNCAVALAIELRKRPHIRLRMGIHAGPVYVVRDINQIADVQGDGIVMAQRVMDCGDAGHILLSHVAADLVKKTPNWAPMLHEMGVCSIKHNQPVHLFNLYAKEFGNRETPRKISTARSSADRSAAFAAVGGGIRSIARVTAIVGLVGGGLWFAAPFIRQAAEGRWAIGAAQKKPSDGKAGKDTGHVKNTNEPAHGGNTPTAVPGERVEGEPNVAVVPNIMDARETKKEGEADARNAGLRVSSQVAFSNEIEPGCAISQSPAAGKRLKIHSWFTVCYSLGVNYKAPLPALKGGATFQPDAINRDTPENEMAGTVSLSAAPDSDVEFTCVAQGKAEQRITGVRENTTQEYAVQLPEALAAANVPIRIRIYQNHVLIGDCDCPPRADAAPAPNPEPPTPKPDDAE